VVIEKDAFIGPHCLIMPGVTVGEGAVVKGGTVLTSNVPPFTLWGYPNPEPLAKVSVPLTPGNSYEEFFSGLKPIKKKKINNKS
jgi:tetrahydrodipicolinate N-succinyltransferase